MGHPDDQEPSDAPEGDVYEEFADQFLNEEDTPEGDDEAPEDGEVQDEAEEPEEPAIDPPVSWAADAKEAFEQLPRELQQVVAEREAQRESRIQQAMNESANARRMAQAEAIESVAEAQRQYASELETLPQALLPQRPDPALLNINPQLFYQLQAEFETGVAQHQTRLQQAAQARQEADQATTQAEEHARQIRLQEAFTALSNETGKPVDRQFVESFLARVDEIGGPFGYNGKLFLEEAGPSDWLFVNRAMEWQDKAAKYDALQKTKMEKVREAKKLPRVSRPGVAPTRGELSQGRSQSAWQNVKGARSKEEQAGAFADYLESAGLM